MRRREVAQLFLMVEISTIFLNALWFLRTFE